MPLVSKLIVPLAKLFQRKKAVGTNFNGYPYTHGRQYSLSGHGPGHKVSAHFTLIEFASRDGADKVIIHDALPPLLEAIREASGGRPLHINSGYRSPAHNSAVGGATNSRHKTGQAADITVRGLSPRQVYRIAKRLNPGGLGKYNSFTHVDIQGNNRRWSG